MKNNWRLCCDEDEWPEIWAFYLTYQPPDRWAIPDWLPENGMKVNCWKDEANKVESVCYKYKYSPEYLNVLACMSASSWGRYFCFNLPNKNEK